jgi:DNA-binding response OmpR family regulator
MARITIIDDDAGVIDACRLFLEREGHLVSGATSREEGKELLVQSPPELLILDVMMREQDDGFALAQELRGEGYSYPILMLSSIGKATGLTYRKNDAILPVNAFEEKPISPARLIAVVDRLLQGKE